MTTPDLRENRPIQDADETFFAALRDADADALAALLTDDFVLIDVMQGSEVPRVGLVAAVAAGQLRFDAIEVVDSRVRRYGSAAVVTGQTAMRGRVGEVAWSARSRYTHVYVEQAGRWLLASAQGTRIVNEPMA